MVASATGVSGERPTDGLGSPAVVGARPTLATALTLLKIDQKCEIFYLPFLQICDDMCLFLHDLCGCVICEATTVALVKCEVLCMSASTRPTTKTNNSINVKSFDCFFSDCFTLYNDSFLHTNSLHKFWTKKKCFTI